MHRQSPDNNNPANPLMKAAALEIDKEYITTGTKQKIRVTASLAFKKSDDFRGMTVTRDGRQVNVTFSLAIRRASLELVCTDDRGSSPDGFVKLDKVAFVGALSSTAKTNSTVIEADKKQRVISAGAKAKAKLGLSGVKPEIGADLKAAASAKRSTTTKQITKVRSESTNVKATFAGCKIHWEIAAATQDSRTAGDAFLDGSVFKHSSSNKSMDACSVTRTDGKAISTVVFTGSVYTSMQDLIVGNINFVDSDGIKIKPNSIAKSTGSGEGFLSPFEFKKIAKERILKQIIRKHLIEQGLKTDGALVEICRASA